MAHPRKTTTAVTLLGFSVAALRPSAAMASSIGAGALTSGTTSSSSDDSSGSDVNMDGTAAATMAASLATASTTAGIIVLLVVLINKGQHGDDPPSLTLNLVDGALLQRDGDLGMQLALVVESPAAFDRLLDEAAAGSGHALGTLSHACRLPPPVVAERLLAAQAQAGGITRREDALRFVGDFVSRLGPDLAADPDGVVRLAWQLNLERHGPDFPTHARTHRWIAGWLGVPDEAVQEASRLAFADLPDDEAVARAMVTSDPRRYLQVMARSVDAHHRPALEARLSELLAQAGAWLPEYLIPVPPVVDEPA